MVKPLTQVSQILKPEKYGGSKDILTTEEFESFLHIATEEHLEQVLSQCQDHSGTTRRPRPQPSVKPYPPGFPPSFAKKPSSVIEAPKFHRPTLPPSKPSSGVPRRPKGQRIESVESIQKLLDESIASMKYTDRAVAKLLHGKQSH